jgi:hypothetical protein
MMTGKETLLEISAKWMFLFDIRFTSIKGKV